MRKMSAKPLRRSRHTRLTFAAVSKVHQAQKIIAPSKISSLLSEWPSIQQPPRHLRTRNAKTADHKKRAGRDWTLGQVWRPVCSRNIGGATGGTNERAHACAQRVTLLARP